jgi:hypothetical protein
MDSKIVRKSLIGFALVLVIAMSGVFNIQASNLHEVSAVTVNIPGTKITAMQVYETGNEILLADEISQSILVFDGTDNALIATIPSVGAGVDEMVINETHGRLYAASDIGQGGTGLVSVIDLSTHQVITQLDPDATGSYSYFIMANDEVHDKVYLAHYSGVSVIDVATNVLTGIPGADYPYPYLKKIDINTITNEIFLAHSLNGLNIINGSTLNVQKIPYPEGTGTGLDIAANEIENKVYVTVLAVPGQTEMGIYILDRDTGLHGFVGAHDLEPLAFNNLSNQLFTGVQVGSHASIVDGATDELTDLDFGDGGVGDIAIRHSTNHAYLASMGYTYLVDGTSRTTYQKIPSGVPVVGGLNIPQVAINQDTGLVYVINDFDYGILTIFQDVPTHRVSGNAGVGGAILSYTDGGPKTITAEVDGSYAFLVTDGWSGTVTPSKTGYAFSPSDRTYPPITTDQVGQDYTSVLVPSDFVKASPGNSSSSHPLSLSITWNPSSHATAYEYCYDTTNNAECNHAEGWRSTIDTSLAVTGLDYSTTYYWQVRAVNGWVRVDANDGAWWSFTTQDSPPPNDDFNNAISFSPPYSTSQVVDFATTAGDDPVFSCALGGQKTMSVWYSYTPVKSGKLILNTAASTYTNVTAVWVGTRGSLTSLGCSSSGELQVNVISGTTYYVEIASYFTSLISHPGILNISVTQLDAPDDFSKTNPANAAADLPANPTLTWEASTGAVSYSYCIDETNDNTCTTWVNNGASTSKSLSGLKANTTYYWQVRATNTGGDTHANAGPASHWSFTTIAGPVNDDFDSPTDLILPFSITQDLTLASSAVDDPNINSPCAFGEKYYKTVWYSYTPAQSGALTVDTFTSNYDTILAAWTGSRGSLTSLACNNNYAGQGLQSRIQLLVSAGTTYMIEVANYNNGTPSNPSLVLHAAFTPPPDAFLKTAPGNAAVNQPVTNLALHWETSAGATSYSYCYYKEVDGSCSTWNVTGATSVTLGTLARDTTYYWQVRANNTGGSTDADGGAYASFTTVPNPPGVFAMISPAPYTSGITIYPVTTFSWNASPGAVTYKVCWNSTFSCGVDFIITSDTSVQVPNLSPNTQYWWQVFAQNAGGETGSSGGWTWFYTAGLPSTFLKSSPADLAVNISTSPTLTWGVSTGATLYQVCYDDSDNDTCNDIWRPTGTTNSISLSGLETTHTYHWQVRAIGPGGIRYSGSESTWWSFITAPPAPDAFQKSSPSDGASSQPYSLTLSWVPAAGATSYEYCYHPSTNPSICNEPWTLTTANTSVDLVGLTSNTTYLWQVRAVNPGGKTGADGGAWWSYTTLPNPPSAFGKTSPLDGALNQPTSLTLTWGGSANAAAFEYCLYPAASTPCAEDAWTDNGLLTSKTVSGLLPGTTYYWHVRAVNVDGTTLSDGTPTFWSFTTRPRMTFISIASQDGWVLETSETGTVGGTINTSSPLRLGDDAVRKQYRSILSFSTGSRLPDTAVITRVTLKIKRQQVVGGGNPVTIFQGFMAAIQRGMFGTSALQASDFQAAPMKTLGPFTPTISSGWYTLNLTAAKGYINKLSTSSGLTQIRLYFKLDDNNNSLANYLSLYGGEAVTSSRPQLIIEYYIPQP